MRHCEVMTVAHPLTLWNSSRIGFMTKVKTIWRG